MPGRDSRHLATRRSLRRILVPIANRVAGEEAGSEAQHQLAPAAEGTRR